jgi:RTX calcium-binding nonapeptide repeat (4 copies)
MVTADNSLFIETVAIQPRDGRLIVGGRSLSAGSWDFDLARYHAITCGGVVVTRVGTAGNDTIIGTSGDDVIFGSAGNDFIDARAGTTLSAAASATTRWKVEAATIYCEAMPALIFAAVKATSSKIKPRIVKASPACRSACWGSTKPKHRNNQQNANAHTSRLSLRKRSYGSADAYGAIARTAS